MRGVRCALVLLGVTTLLGIAALSGCNTSSSGGPGLTNPGTPQPTNTVSDTVTFKGAPLAGATVTLWLANSNIVVSTTTTGVSGNYSFSGLSTSGNAPADYQIWVDKTGYGFYPSVQSPGKVERFDHTGQFIEPLTLGTPMYFTLIDFISLPNASLTGANFSAYDGTNPPVSIAATGQITSYANGDDGALRQGVTWPEGRFTDNQDGTVTDHLTGLIWLKDASCLEAANWSAALTEANKLASGACELSDSSAAGDWRLPNLGELESVVDISASNPAITPGSPFKGVADILYWTSTSYFGGDLGSPAAWAIRMSDGRYINDGIQNVKTVSLNGVWAVRGAGTGTGKLQATGLFQPPLQAGDDGTLQMGVGLISPRFIDNGNGTVTDTMTGFIWLKQASCIEGDWATANAAVTALASGQCGLIDGSAPGSWRMPNRNEMQSLADRNQNNEADYFNFTYLNLDQSVFQAAIFSNLFGYQYYWTSTTDAANTSEAWTVFSCDFGVYDVPKSNAGYTLAVRSGPGVH